MQDVIPDRKADETVERHDITELLYVDDTFDFAKDVPFRHEVWMLEIKYKPIRMIWADIPGPDARMQRKQIWYMVYQVTNPGKAFRSVPDDKPCTEQTLQVGDRGQARAFYPGFHAGSP